MNNHYTKVEIIGSEDILNKIKDAIDNPEILKKYEDQYDYKINDYFVYAGYILKELHVNVKKYWKWNIKAWWGHPQLVSQNKLEFKQLSNNLNPKGWRGATMLQSQYPSDIMAINFYELPECCNQTSMDWSLASIFLLRKQMILPNSCKKNLE